MPVTDLKFTKRFAYTPATITAQEELLDAYRQISIFSNNRLSSSLYLSKMCKSLSRSLQGEKLFMPRSISLYGICSNDFQRKFTRHRSLSQGTEKQTLSYGHPRRHISKYFGKCQQNKKLADLCRLRSISHSNSTTFVHQRRVQFRTGKYSLCSGLFDYRSLPKCVSLGPLQKDKGSNQTAYSFGSSWQHSHVHSYYRWKAPRRQCVRYSNPGSRQHLRYGPRLYGLRTTLYDASKYCLFRYQGQSKFKMPSNLLSPSRQNQRVEVRSDRNANRILHCQGLSRKNQTDKILRSRKRQKFCFPNQQFSFASNDSNRTLPVSLADRIIFQMDKAAPPNKDILWNN